MASSPLADFILKPIPPELCELYVADFVTTDGTWNWPKFSHLLSHNAVMRIESHCLCDGNHLWLSEFPLPYLEHKIH